MSDFGLGDKIISEKVLFKTLRWHGLMPFGVVPKDKLKVCTEEKKPGLGDCDLSKDVTPSVE